MSETIERYRRWYEYEQEMHAKTLASLETVPVERRVDAGYQDALDVLAHVAAARHLWLHRFGAVPGGPATIFPKGASPAGVAAMLEDVQASWRGYLGGLDAAEVARTFDYAALDGKRWRSRIEDVLTQLFGHSIYHRGQIAALVRALGGSPAVTDFVYWSREALED